jgi:hypothetical protein
MFAKPERQRDTARIDGLSAIADALARAIVYVPEGETRLEAW